MGKYKKLITQKHNKLNITPFLLSCKKLWKKYVILKMTNPNKKNIISKYPYCDCFRANFTIKEPKKE